MHFLKFGLKEILTFQFDYPYRDPMVQIIKPVVQVRKPGPVLFSTPRIWDLDHPPISNFDHRELILHISTKRSVALLA